LQADTRPAIAVQFLERMAAQFDITGEELGASPAVLVGTVDAICEKVVTSAQYGFSHVH
jgi:hypothetical protein